MRCGDESAPAPSSTSPARNVSRFPAAVSIASTSAIRPPRSLRPVTSVRGRTSRPRRTSSGSTAVATSFFAETAHAKVSHVVQARHGTRGPFRWLMASGSGNGVSPRLRAAPATSCEVGESGAGACGKGRLRGGSDGSAPASPLTPRISSARE